MKLLSTPFILLIFLSSLTAGPLFREVGVYQDTWDVTFHQEGGRYGIQINGFNRGTSGYLQRLVLKSDETLRLIDKHWHMDIRPVDRDGKPGIEITRVYRDRFSDEQKREVTFEATHEAEQDGGGDSGQRR